MEQLTQHQINNLPEWMPIPDYPDYEVNCRAGIVRNSRNLRVLKPLIDKHGYLVVTLRADGRNHVKKVHRIIALTAFGYYGIQIEGLDVCHLDETRTDPRVSNLALGSRRENMAFPKAKQRISEAHKGKPNIKLHKPVGAYKNGQLVLTFQCIKDAEKDGFNHSHISDCCLGKRRAHRGYQWRYLKS